MCLLLPGKKLPANDIEKEGFENLSDKCIELLSKTFNQGQDADSIKFAVDNLPVIAVVMYVRPIKRKKTPKCIMGSKTTSVVACCTFLPASTCLFIPWLVVADTVYCKPPSAINSWRCLGLGTLLVTMSIKTTIALLCVKNKDKAGTT